MANYLAEKDLYQLVNNASPEVTNELAIMYFDLSSAAIAHLKAAGRDDTKDIAFKTLLTWRNRENATKEQLYEICEKARVDSGLNFNHNAYSFLCPTAVARNKTAVIVLEEKQPEKPEAETEQKQPEKPHTENQPDDFKDEHTQYAKSTILKIPENDEWKNLQGMDDLKKKIHDNLIKPVLSPHLCTGLRAPEKGVLLCGKPGTGKTMLAKALAGTGYFTFFNVSSSDIVSKWLGETDKIIKALFKVAHQKRPSLIFFDEADSMFPNREGSSHSAVKSAVNVFLQMFDGVEEFKGISILAATNLKTSIDPAMIRPGRIGAVVEMPPLTEENRLAIIKKLLDGETLHTDIDLKKIAEITEGCTPADIHGKLREVAKISGDRAESNGDKVPTILLDDFKRVFNF